MAARHCDACDRNYKPGADRTVCPMCGEPLSYSTKHDPDTPWPEEPLPPVTPELEQEVAKGWDELRREAEAKGWSLVDALEARDRAA